MYLSILPTLGGVANETRFRHFLEVKRIVYILEYIVINAKL